MRRALPSRRLPFPAAMPISEALRLTLSHKEKPLLTHPTRDTRHALQLRGRYEALIEQTQRPEMTAVPCAARLGLLVARALTTREDRRLKSRVHQAKLRHTACSEAID